MSTYLMIATIVFLLGSLYFGFTHILNIEE